MRQYSIVSQICIILSVINLAFAAPLVMRERHEVRVDVVGVTKDGTATSRTLSQWVPRDEWQNWLGAIMGPEPPTSSDSDSESPDESDLEPEPNSSGSSHNSPPGSPGSSSSTESPPGSPLGLTHAYPQPGGGDGMASHGAIAEGSQPLLLPNSLAEANPSSPDHSSPHLTPTASSSSAYPGLSIVHWVADDPLRIAWYEALKAPPPPASPSTGSDYTYGPDSSSHSTSSGSTLGSTGSEYPYSTESWSTGSEYYSTDSGFTGSDYSYSTGLGPTGTDYTYYSTGSSSSSGASHDDPDSPSSNSWDRMPVDASTSSLSTKHSPPQGPGQTDSHPPPSPLPNPAPSTGPQQSTNSLAPASSEPQSPAEPEAETFISKLLKGKIKRQILVPSL